MSEDIETTKMPIEELLAMMRADSKTDPNVAAVLENFHARIKASEEVIATLQGRTIGQMRMGGHAGG